MADETKELAAFLGGLGIGATAAHSYAELLVADGFDTMVCRKCGIFARSVGDEGGYCKSCNTRDVAKVGIPYAFKPMCQELMAMNGAPRLMVRRQ